eukprot:364705-Chlamydomonas_euryale.AAC.16
MQQLLSSSFAAPTFPRRFPLVYVTAIIRIPSLPPAGGGGRRRRNGPKLSRRLSRDQLCYRPVTHLSRQADVLDRLVGVEHGVDAGRGQRRRLHLALVHDRRQRRVGQLRGGARGRAGGCADVRAARRAQRGCHRRRPQRRGGGGGASGRHAAATANCGWRHAVQHGGGKQRIASGIVGSCGTKQGGLGGRPARVERTPQGPFASHNGAGGRLALPRAGSDRVAHIRVAGPRDVLSPLETGDDVTSVRESLSGSAGRQQRAYIRSSASASIRRRCGAEALRPDSTLGQIPYSPEKLTLTLGELDRDVWGAVVAAVAASEAACRMHR